MVISEEIISKNVIKPSSPTPNRFKNHKLSYLDQIAPPMYVPLILFYQNDESKPKQQVEISQLLKQSLSRILTIFYPLAGTLVQENSHVDCNDAGVKFVEARVHAGLAQIIEDPKMEELKKLVPVDGSSHSDDAILLVKINFFDCGGIAVGVCLSHKVADFASLVLLFMNAWAATCRGETQVIQPSFDMAVRFPPRDSTPSCFTPDEEKIATKRLVFDREKLERLRQQAASTSEVKNPTTVEALSSFIWQDFNEATKAKLDAKRTSFVALHAVNLRPRTVPPIPNHAFGNCSICTFAFISSSSDDLVSKSRAAMGAVDDSYIQKVINDEEYLRTLHKVTHLCKSNIDLCIISSWWRFPLYDIDFGWGKPVWVCTTTVPYKNAVILISTPSRDGIEAWINTSEDFLPMLETNYNKLLS